MNGRSITSAAAAAIAVGTTAVGWSALFVGSITAWLVALAAALGAALGQRRLNPWQSIAAGVVVLSVVVAVGAPIRLASDGILMSVGPRMLAIPIGVTVVAAAWTARCWRPAGFAPGALLAVVPVLLAHCVAAAFSTSVAPLGFGLGAVTVVAVVVGVVASRFRGWVGSAQLLGLGAAMALVGVVGVWFGDDDPFDLRSRLVPPVQVVASTSPLSMVKAGLVEETPEPVFTISVTGLEPGTELDRVPAAVLDHYDGAVWSSSATFVPAGAVLSPPTEAQPVGDDVDFSVELTDHYPFDQVPLPGELRRISDGGLLWDSRTGGVVSKAGVRSYGGTAAPWAFDDESTAAPGGVGGYVALPPDIPTDTIDAFLTSTLSGTDRRAWLDQLTTALRSAGYSDQVPAGHSVAALSSYLDGIDGVTVGFAEQSAATFVVGARRLDIPARVVVGYRLEEPLTSSNSTATVLEDDIDAWPEVWIGDQGWVRFDPTDRNNQSPVSSLSPPASGDGSDDPSTASEAPLPPVEEPLVLPDELEPDSAPRFWVLLALVPLIYLIAVAGFKAVRRRMRRRGEPDRRVIGAWREVNDRLRDAGRHPGPRGTVIDLRDRLTDGDPGSPIFEPMATLADGVDRAVYSPEGATEADADAAWAASDETVAVLNSDWGAPTRVRAAISARSLARRN